MKIVIVDRNSDSRRELHMLLKDLTGGMDSIIEYSSMSNLEEDLNDGLVDEDIYYVGLSGNRGQAIRTAEKIKEGRPLSQIIFMLTDSVFCEECYEVEHVYCISRPYSRESVSKSYEKARNRVSECQVETFSFSFGGKVSIVKLSDIVYFEKDKRKVRVYRKDGNIQEFYETMDSLVDRLSGAFARCHNSYVVNLGFASELTSNGIVMTDGRIIPISRRYFDSIKKLINR